MKKYRRGIFSLALCLSSVPLLAAGIPENPPAVELAGLYDGYSYTSPFSFFTVYLEGNLQDSRLEDEWIHSRTGVEFNFRDLQNNVYVIAASLARQDMPADFIDQLLQREYVSGHKGEKGKTPDGEDCVIATILQRDPKSDSGVGKVNLIFLRNRVIFDVKIISHSADSPREAARAGEEALNRLWGWSVFRGWPQDLPAMPDTADPRLPVIVRAARQAAADLGYRFEYDQQPELFLRISTTGAHGGISLRFTFQGRLQTLGFTQETACAPQDRALADKVRQYYLKALLAKLKAEKIQLRVYSRLKNTARR